MHFRTEKTVKTVISIFIFMAVLISVMFVMFGCAHDDGAYEVEASSDASLPVIFEDIEGVDGGISENGGSVTTGDGENGKETVSTEDAPANSDIATIFNIYDYAIVYPEGYAGLEQASAMYLSNHILEEVGYRLEVYDDSHPEGAYEILIGGTNRTASREAAALDYRDNELLIKGEATSDGGKIVLYGNGLMAAGAMGQFAARYISSPGGIQSDGAHPEGIQIPATAEITEYAIDDPSNIIIVIGDGMGFAHIELAKANGSGAFVAELLPNRGSLLTDCYPGETTDSAAAATALSSGYKTRYTYVGVDKDKTPRQNIRELAAENGYRTAVVTTDELSGATPAAFLAHTSSRYETSAINAQIAEVKEKEGDMLYIAGTDGGPMLDDVTAALKHGSAGSGGFFIMVEESLIDYHSHYHEKAELANSIRRLDESVAYIIAFTMAHPDTILIVAADHETGGLTQKDDGTFDFTKNDHTSTPVPIFAWGKGTEMFDGKETENNEVARFLARAIFGIDNFGD